VVSDPGHFHTVRGTSLTGGNISTGPGTNGGIVDTDTKTTGISINAAGGNESRPINIALLTCIKY
jgi:hypothetical protein